MKILYIDAVPNKQVKKILKKIDTNFYTFEIRNHILNIKKNIKRDKTFIFFLLEYIIKFPILISKGIINNLEKSPHSRDLRNSIIDQIERESGELSTKNNSKNYLKKKFFNYTFKLFKIVIFLEFIKLYTQKKNINCIIIPQFDGFPYGGITSFCIKKNLFLGAGINKPPTLLVIRKGDHNIHCPLDSDVESLRKLSNKELDIQIEQIKEKYIHNKIKFINLPNKKSITNNKEVNYYKSIINPSKKTGLVLLHHFSDQARPRLIDSWYENYLDWFIETINFCKKNNNLNWIFKSHPNGIWYPLKKKQEDFIKNLVKDNNFQYIDSTKTKFLHNEVSKIASIVVTCGGTCKIEYPALFGIPVISCYGRDSLYLYEGLTLIANSQSEYKELILNAHKHSITKKEIRYCKEALTYLHNKNLKPNQNDKEIKIFKYYDSNNEIILRNY